MADDDPFIELEYRSPHIRVKSPDACLKCVRKQCTIVCPASVYRWDGDEGKIQVDWLACLETGACLVVCNEFNNIEMNYPDSGVGVRYKSG
jgi:ferredoxin like protein